ncbi:MAG: hypothetical protein JXA14_18065 [Anaerolineae bacterium]|jgi:hypothetical protein|nr:hypothetical protein [Anaerolineae bacterium]
MEQVTVRKLDHAVCQVLAYPGAVLRHAGQWYNIFGICASDGRSQGRCCDITRLACIGSDEVSTGAGIRGPGKGEFAAPPLSPAELQATLALRQNSLFDKRHVDV